MDALVRRKRGRQRIHLILHESLNARMIHQLLAVSKADALFARISLQAREVRHDERTDKLAPVADDQHLPDVRLALEEMFELLRRHILAARRLEQMLLAAGNHEVTVRIQLSEVTGVEPAVLESRTILFIQVVIARRNIR